MFGLPSKSMIGENRQLVTDEPVEFEKEPVEVEDFRRITDHFRRIYGIHPQINKKKTEGYQHVTGWTCKH